VRPRLNARFTSLLFLAICASVLLAPEVASAAWPTGVRHVAVSASRVAGRDVYSAAVAVAQRAYPGYGGIAHVVVASGEPSAIFDATAASSLCWAYDAPLLLVKKGSVPAPTRDALARIVSANTSVTVHVVGPSTAIAAASVAQIRSAVGTSTVEQPWKSANRYSLAAAAAQRVRQVAAANGSVVPTAALVVNGSNTSQAWDALAASVISRHTGIPLLFTTSSSIPSPTSAALTAAGLPRVIVIGSSTAVPGGVYWRLRARERWGGSNRFTASASVASHAAHEGWSEVATFGVAAAANDALVGAQLVGAQGGVLLFTRTDHLDRSAWTFLSARQSQLSAGYAFGGRSIPESQLAELRGAAARPWLEGEAPGRYVGKKFRVTGWVGGNTTRVNLYVRGKKVRTTTIRPWGRFNFTSV
jgi:N-acetylmuramoyl-L-alanine amidase